MKLKSEQIYILIIFGILLFLGFASLFSNKLTHDFPQGFNANDAFYKYNRAHNLAETSNWKNIEEYTVEGRKDLLQDDSPLAYVLTVVFSSNSKIPDFDAYQLIGIISKILAAFIIYMIIRKFNPKVALISLVIVPFIFIKNNFISFYFGWIPITLAASILILLIWLLLNFELKSAWLILGIIISSVLLTHLSEFYYAILITNIILIYLLIKNKNRKILTKTSYALVIFIILTFYFLPIFINNSLSLAQDKSVVTISALKQPSFPITLLSDFSFFQYFIILGILISFYYCYQHKEKIIYFLPLYILIIISNFPLLGMHDRFYQLRYFWPIIFMIFFGLSIYYIINLILRLKPFKNINDNLQNIIYIILTLLFIILSINLYYTPPSPNSLVVNKDMWEGMQWVKNNIPENKTILIVHGDSYQQHGIFLMFGKVIHQIKDEDYYTKLNSGQISKNYTIRKFIHGYDYYKRTGFFTFEPVKLGKPEWEQTRGWEETNLCDFEYYVIDKPSRFPQVINYNAKIRATLLNNKDFTEIFSNGWYSILKNNNPGADCLGK
ncbi:glycosyltransferase family 39 protein [Candidatus Woesearchaeota archaeon]|nr:glycosyltransferase family 39 protein [Candidatus Woesearchaeota archaeon]